MMSQDYGQLLYIQLEQPPIRTSGHCHASTSWDFVLSTMDDFGKQMMSQVLVAYTAQNFVKVAGNDVCDIRPTTETLTRIELH